MTPQRDANYWIKELNLIPHPEGGFYSEVYRSQENIPHSALPSRFSGPRPFSTSIFYLLKRGDFSAFHRICSDETWHFYDGGALEVVMLKPEGASTIRLGRDIHDGEHLQFTVSQGIWFASRPTSSADFSLVGCTVSPGFDFADFEMATCSTLLETYPHCESLIRSLTR